MDNGWSNCNAFFHLFFKNKRCENNELKHTSIYFSYVLIKRNWNFGFSLIMCSLGRSSKTSFGVQFILRIFLHIFKESYLDEWREHKQFDGDRMKWRIYVRSGFVDIKDAWRHLL